MINLLLTEFPRAVLGEYRPSIFLVRTSPKRLGPPSQVEPLAEGGKKGGVSITLHEEKIVRFTVHEKSEIFSRIIYSLPLYRTLASVMLLLEFRRLGWVC